MPLFRYILQTIVFLRTAREEPLPPQPSDTLLSYAARLHRQFQHAGARAGRATHQDTHRIARFLILWLGLREAAEPLPASLVYLVEQDAQPRRHAGPNR